MRLNGKQLTAGDIVGIATGGNEMSEENGIHIDDLWAILKPDIMYVSKDIEDNRVWGYVDKPSPGLEIGVHLGALVIRGIEPGVGYERPSEPVRFGDLEAGDWFISQISGSRYARTDEENSMRSAVDLDTGCLRRVEQDAIVTRIKKLTE